MKRAVDEHCCKYRLSIIALEKAPADDKLYLHMICRCKCNHDELYVQSDRTPGCLFKYQFNQKIDDYFKDEVVLSRRYNSLYPDIFTAFYKSIVKLPKEVIDIIMRYFQLIISIVDGMDKGDYLYKMALLSKDEVNKIYYL